MNYLLSKITHTLESLFLIRINIETLSIYRSLRLYKLLLVKAVAYMDVACGNSFTQTSRSFCLDMS